jgi:hypothetical protein
MDRNIREQCIHQSKTKCTGLAVRALAILAAAALAPTARATVITFDDIPFNGSDGSIGVSLDDGYQGLNWSNMSVDNIPAMEHVYGITGYSHGVVSGTQVALGNYPDFVGTITSDTAMTFNSAYFTAAWNNGLIIDVSGYLHGILAQQTSFVIDSTGPTLETFNWTVDKIVINPHGGTSAGYEAGMHDDNGLNFVIDNLVINEPIPEPATLAVLSAGIVFLLARRRR